MGKKKAEKELERLQVRLKEAEVSTAAHEPWSPFVRARPLPQLPDDVIFLNSRYQVNVRHFNCPPPFNDGIELSIKTRDKAPFHSWRDLQRIKNELIGTEVEAVELYPAESRLVDTANQYYLYAFPHYSSQKLPFGFKNRYVSEVSVRGSVQEPFPPDARPKDLETPEQSKERQKAIMDDS